MAKVERTLVEITKDHLAMEEILAEVDGEINQTEEQWLEENQSNLSQKVDSYKVKMDLLDFAEQYLKSKAEPFISAARTCGNHREFLKNRLKWCMNALNLSEIAGQDYVFKLSTGGKKLVIKNESEIPATYFNEKIVLELDKERLKSALESGASIPGAVLEDIKKLTDKVNATTIKPKKGK